MKLRLTHNKRPFQEIETTWDRFVDRYLSNTDPHEAQRIHDAIFKNKIAELREGDHVLSIERIGGN